MATPPNSRFQAAMTSPFPFLPPRPPGRRYAGPQLAPPGRPRPSPGGRGLGGLSCPLPAGRRGLQRPPVPPRARLPPEPRGGGHRPRGGPPSRSGLPATPAALWELPRALAAGEAGAGRRQASLAAGAAACLAWEGPAAPSSESGDRGRGPRRWLRCLEGLWPGRQRPCGCARGPAVPSRTRLPCPGLSWATCSTPRS